MRPTLKNASSNDIPKKLKQVREEFGLTQQQVAGLLKRPQSYVSRCEMGIKHLEIKDLEAFCRIYKKTISFFLSE
jgi:transcriptional regulator with XRE-family HTH domain